MTGFGCNWVPYLSEMHFKKKMTTAGRLMGNTLSEVVLLARGGKASGRLKCRRLPDYGS